METGRRKGRDVQQIGQIARRVVEQAGRAREAANENNGAGHPKGPEEFSVQQPQLHGRAGAPNPRNARPVPRSAACANDNEPTYFHKSPAASHDLDESPC